MARDALQVEVVPTSPSMDHFPLPQLHTSSSDLTQSTFAADASDVARVSTPSSAATSIDSTSGPASQPQTQPQTQPQSESRPKLPAQTLHAEPAAIQTSNSASVGSVERRDDDDGKPEKHHKDATPAIETATETKTTTTVTTNTPPRSPSAKSVVALDTPIQFTHGQKRMATGEPKLSASPARFQTPKAHVSGATAAAAAAAAAGGHHSRTTSTDSNASRIAEVSAQLRAKLSCAAARVESQRQLRSPESKHTSRSSESLTSPAQSAPRPRQSLSFSHSEPRGFGHEQSQKSNTTNHGLVGVGSTATNNGSWMPPNGQNGNDPWRPSAKLDMAQIPKLAPPADIVARNGISAPRRRPNPNLANQSDVNHNSRDTAFKSPDKPPLPQQLSNSLSQTSFPVRDTPPPLHQQASSSQRTPAIADSSPKHRTPSQNALMEQDAIETLLFMSSPENSGYRAKSQPTQPSNLNSVSCATMPASTQCSQPALEPAMGQRIQWDVNPASKGDGDLTESARSSQSYNTITNPRGGPQQPRDEIDRILDEMPDSDSDTDDGWLTRLAGQHQPPKQQSINNQDSLSSGDMSNTGSHQSRLYSSFP